MFGVYKAKSSLCMSGVYCSLCIYCSSLCLVCLKRRVLYDVWCVLKRRDVCLVCIKAKSSLCMSGVY